MANSDVCTCGFGTLQQHESGLLYSTQVYKYCIVPFSGRVVIQYLVHRIGTALQLSLLRALKVNVPFSASGNKSNWNKLDLASGLEL